VVIKYDNFINQLIIFLITSIALFIFIYKFQQMLTNLEKKKEVVKKKAESVHIVIWRYMLKPLSVHIVLVILMGEYDD